MIAHVISIDVPESELLKRISGRRTCRACGAMYHEKNRPSAEKGRCDKCGGELSQRDDDKEETVKERLNIYKKQTQPLIEYYAEKSLIRPINGLGGVDDIFDRVTEVMG